MLCNLKITSVFQNSLNLNAFSLLNCEYVHIASHPASFQSHLLGRMKENHCEFDADVLLEQACIAHKQ